MSDPTPHKPEHYATEPIRPLDYGAGDYGVPDVSPARAVGHFFAGIGGWLAVLATAWIAVNTRHDLTTVGVILLIGFFVLLGLGAYLHGEYKWRTFTPGVLVAVALTCLIPIGIAAVVCGGMGR